MAQDAAPAPPAAKAPSFNAARSMDEVSERVHRVLVSKLDIPDLQAAEVARRRGVRLGLLAHPCFHAQVEGTVQQLIVEVGMGPEEVARLVLADPAFLVRAPRLPADLGALNRLLSSMFGLYPRTSRWTREAWRALLRDSPAVLCITPARAEAVLQWWRRLAAAAGWADDELAAYVDRALRRRPWQLAAGDWHARRKVRALCALCGVPEAERAEFALRVMEAQAQGLRKFTTAAELEAAVSREAPRFARRAVRVRAADTCGGLDPASSPVAAADEAGVAAVAARMRRLVTRWRGVLELCRAPERVEGNVLPAGRLRDSQRVRAPADDMARGSDVRGGVEERDVAGAA